LGYQARLLHKPSGKPHYRRDRSKSLKVVTGKKIRIGFTFAGLGAGPVMDSAARLGIGSLYEMGTILLFGLVINSINIFLIFAKLFLQYAKKFIHNAQNTLHEVL